MKRPRGFGVLSLTSLSSRSLFAQSSTRELVHRVPKGLEFHQVLTSVISLAARVMLFKISAPP